jgi:hypothetical protein
MQMTENSDRQKTLDELYEQIKTKGYRIDVRGVYPILTKINSQNARKFDTMEAAIMFALDEIREGR